MTDPTVLSEQDAGSLFFVGNATTIIRYRGFTLLTDPNFLHQGQRAYLGWGLSSVRQTEPALGVEQLPALDAVILSHLHGDHFDRVARHGLDRNLPILTNPHASRRLQLYGFSQALGLRLWRSHTLVKDGWTVRVTALPGQHAPGLAQLLLPEVMGSMLEFAPAGGEVTLRVYLSGDTLMFAGIRQIRRRYPRIDLGVLHLGGTMILGKLMVTMDGRQGADLLATLQPQRAVPVHYDDYAAFASPLSDFRDEVAARGLADHVTYLDRGESLALIPESPSATPG